MIKKETFERLMKFRDDRDWSQFHTGENLAKSICIESAELLEVFQWEQKEKSIEKTEKNNSTFSLMLHDKDIRLMCLPVFLHGVVKDNVSFWMALYFASKYGVDVKSIGMFAVFIPLVGLVGRFLYPFLFKFVKENMECKILSYKGNVFGVEPPLFVELQVTETDPGFKGDTATNAKKPATLETGAVVNVPFFITNGTIIRVDTRTNEYLDRV